MSNHAYVVVASLPGATELYIVVSGREEEAGELIIGRADARFGESVAVAAQVHDDVAATIGADLFRSGLYGRYA